MTSSQGPEIIAPALFAYVTEYAKEIETRRVDMTENIKGRHPLWLFCENFLAQFSAGYLHRSIEGFNERSQAQLTEERRKLEGDATRTAAQLLIFHLAPLCSRMPEISYSNSDQDVEEFHTDYFPELLSRINVWLEECGASDMLKAAASEANAAYSRAIENYS